ncbi:MAG: site-specific integrase [Actinomycetota bacterium]|jgi:integrase|nr:site-specific integrase [Actinomycetota bacterium]MCL6093567.1 site-specific integrase [Actinomycetota bacterium]MDA8166165.1 site-specific integrase [Actinomycetota bacterium]
MAKRGQNEGSIYKAKDGRWVGCLNLGYQGGTRKRKYLYGKTRAEVSAKLTEALRNRQLGLPVSNDKITFGQFLDKWLEDSVKPSVRPRTFKSYSQLVERHIAPDLGNIKLAKLCPRDIQSLINRKLDSGLSPRSVQYIHAVIRRALVQARKWELVPRNVAKLVDPPRTQHFEVKPLSPDQARTFLEAAKGDRLEALYTVAVSLGLRRGECLALRWEDVDLEARTLRVCHTLQRVDGGGWELAEPKSKNSRRTLGLPVFATLALREHRKHQLEEKMLAGPHWQDHDFVFTSKLGTPLDGQHLYFRHFKMLLRKAGLPDIRFHDLRHSCASLLLVQGVSPRVVMETLGHSQISLTMNTYSHVMPVLMKEAAEKMDEVLGFKL